jgi:hypothetical protein
MKALYTFDAFSVVPMGIEVRIVDNTKCYSVMYEAKTIGYISYNARLDGILMNTYRARLVAHHGDICGFDPLNVVMSVTYPEMGG